MLIKTFIIKSTVTPRGYPSRPLRVQRNREITNIAMLPAKWLKWLLKDRGENCLNRYHRTSYIINAKNALLQRHLGVRQKSPKVEVQCGSRIRFKERARAALDLAPLWCSCASRRQHSPAGRLGSPHQAASGFSRCAWRTLPVYSLNHFVDTNEHPSSAVIIGPWQVNIIGISLTKHTPQRHVQLRRLYFSARGLRGC